MNSQPSTQLLSIDAKDDDVHYTSPPIYLPLSSSTIHSLHLTHLDERHQEVAPKLFNLVLLINDNKAGIYRV